MGGGRSRGMLFAALPPVAWELDDVEVRAVREVEDALRAPV